VTWPGSWAGRVLQWLWPAPGSTATTYPKPRPREFEKFLECYFCGSKEFHEGPSGGASMNVTCAGCGARFNIALVPGGPLFQEELSPPKPRNT